jgi:4-amino-4-deoxy-L-arabinose transferase-like glycosyltransferase
MPETLEQTIVERRTFARSAPQSAVPAVPQPYAGTGGTLIRALLVVAGLFFALHYVHLRADFPNHSQWMDWAKYTDEGWYGDAAIRHYLLGHWNVPGDFNPAAALPVWPVLELILFRVTGVSLAAARFLSVTVFGLTLLVCYRLMQLWRPAGVRSGSQRLAPALTVLLLAVSPFCFVFSRLAILEPLLVLCTALAALAATHAGRATLLGEPGRVRTLRWSIALGVLLPLAVLTKTTAIFLFPAIGWTLLAACGFRMRPLLRSSAIAGGVAALLWLGYYGLYVRPHALVDYRYLFSANTYTGFGWNTLPTLLHDTIQDTVWMGRPLLWLGLPAIAWAVVAAAIRSPSPCCCGSSDTARSLPTTPICSPAIIWSSRCRLPRWSRWPSSGVSSRRGAGRAPCARQPLPSASPLSDTPPYALRPIRPTSSRTRSTPGSRPPIRSVTSSIARRRQVIRAFCSPSPGRTFRS